MSADDRKSIRVNDSNNNVIMSAEKTRVMTSFPERMANHRTWVWKKLPRCRNKRVLSLLKVTVKDRSSRWSCPLNTKQKTFGEYEMRVVESYFRKDISFESYAYLCNIKTHRKRIGLTTCAFQKIMQHHDLNWKKRCAKRLNATIRV